MIAHKHIDRVALTVIAAALVFCVGAMLLAPRLTETYGAGVSMEYEQKIFDTSGPVTIDIQMEPSQWRTMLDSAMQEVYYPCDVVINGTTFRDVGIRPKGNTSLSSIAMNPDTERFSFKLEFDQFIDGQTAWGLDKLCLNNNYADATNMKEALIYDMYQYLGADASLYNHAAIYVNGAYWGVYLALEAVEDSFMLRNYGVQDSALYKPDRMGIGGSSFEPPGFMASDEPDEEPEPTPVPTAEPDPMPPEGQLSQDMQAIVDMTETGNESASGEPFASVEPPDFGGFDPFGGGQNLNYTDDDLDSYSTIWKCEVTKTNIADHRRVVEALRHISRGEELETYMDVDNLLRFMAVHNFSVNGDSLSGGMAHNYYLYESGGRLNILPWDYNLALGGMGMGGSNASEVVNDPIDDSWQSTSFFDGLLKSEQYLARYHEYYRALAEEYIAGGGFDRFYERTRSQIDTLVRDDPNALYDYDEYDAAAETLYHLVKLRGESILGQLDGTIPSTTGGQRQDSSSLIDASDIDLSIMGSMSPGGRFGGSGEPTGETTDGADSESASSDESDGEAAGTDEQASREISFPDLDGGFPFASGEMQSGPDWETILTLAACGVVLIAGLVFAARFKRHL